MEIHRDFDSIPKLHFPVVTIGIFDGVHIGHQSIINQLVHQAQQHKGESIVITFDPHPRKVLNPGSGLELLNTLDERIEKLMNLKINHLVIIQFTAEFSELTTIQFINKILIEKLHTKILVMGYDHHFGKNREGSFTFLKNNLSESAFGIIEEPAIFIDNKPASSSFIRNALKNGELIIANQFLGMPYQISGTVSIGHQIGRTIGFPTANIQVTDPNKLIPSNGVYAVEARIQKAKPLLSGMINIGTRPTFSDEKIRNIELHLFNFDGNIYGKEITVYFKNRIRDEKKFNHAEELKSQLVKDKEISLKLLGF